MLQLPNNCRAGKMSVYPSNWKTVRANYKLNWRISYWFYDDVLKQKKKVVLKGMNSLQSLKEKQRATQLLMDDEVLQIQLKGFNRVTQTYSVLNNEADISEYTPFVLALEWALSNVKVEPKTKQDIDNTLQWIVKAIRALHYENLMIGEVKRKHIKLLLEKCGKIKASADIKVGKTTRKGIWSANQFNTYRKYLSILFTELREVDAVEVNWCKEVSKEKSVRKLRQVLTKDERTEINTYLLESYPTFWRFLHIFFHSGCRESEMMVVKKQDVDLQNQRFKIVVKKGLVYNEDYRTIKTIALPLWQQVMNEAKDGQYLFSVGLVPGNKNIRPDQITKRWYRLVKKKKGITADFYALKHLHTTEMINSISEQAAALHNGHTSTAMVRSIYDVNRVERKHNKVKDSGVAF
jgi:integrase